MSFNEYNGVMSGLVCMPAPFSINTQYDEGHQYTPVPLVKVHVEARVVNFVSQVEVTHKYVNKGKNPIETIFLFPVEEEVAVVDFTAEMDGRIIKTVVKERGEAKQEYHEAVKSKQTAFLLEETRPDLFQIQVGHLTPGSGCTTTITYLTELPMENGKTKLTVPTTVAPRCGLSEFVKMMENIDLDPASMTFKLETIMKTRIKGIESLGHKIINKIERESDNNNFYVAETSFEGYATDMDRDIVILIDTDEPTEPKVILEKNLEGSTVAMVSLVPSFQLKDISAEIVFLVDCSGSMSGKSINLAKEALQLFLHSLPLDCYFNVFYFGSSFVSLFPESKKYDDNTLDAAKKLASRLSANLGGADIVTPLEHIFQQKPIPGKLRQIFVLTDGEVSDSSRCVSCVKKNSDTSRVFTLGIGTSQPNRHLIKEIARAGQGSAAFVLCKGKMAPKILKQLKNSLQPCINKIQLDWGDEEHQSNSKLGKPGMETTKTLLGFRKYNKDAVRISMNTQAPMNFPAIYDGSRLSVFKKFSGDKQPENIKLKAEKPYVDMVLKVDKENVLEGDSVHQMFARKLIQDIEESKNCLDECYALEDDKLPRSECDKVTMDYESELECPVCFTLMKPPRKIWQCCQGHAICGVCYINPAIKKRCPTCRRNIIGRNIGMEKITAAFLKKPGGKKKAQEDIGILAKRRKGSVPRNSIVRCPYAKKGCKQLMMNDDRLEEHRTRCAYQDLNFVADSEENGKNKKSIIVVIGIKYNLASKFTSFIGVARNKEESNSITFEIVRFDRLYI